jgi:hypothetical protein
MSSAPKLLAVLEAFQFAQVPVLMLSRAFAEQSFRSTDARFFDVEIPALSNHNLVQSAQCLKSLGSDQARVWERIYVHKSRTSSSVMLEQQRNVTSSALVVLSTFNLARQIESEMFGTYGHFADHQLKSPPGVGYFFQSSSLSTW